MSIHTDRLIAAAARHDRDAITALLDCEEQAVTAALATHAFAVMESTVGANVYYRGLLEFSNVCVLDCYYCGIRAQDTAVSRYTLSEEEIMEAAHATAALGYGSMTLQSGERSDAEFVGFVTRVLQRIKRETVSDALPEGLGITLCVGEQDPAAYRAFFDAGAHQIGRAHV